MDAKNSVRLLLTGLVLLLSAVVGYDYYLNEISGQIGIETAVEDGAFLITGVVPGLPADRAGLQAGDRLHALNDTVIEPSFLSIQNFYASLRTLDAAQLTIERNGRLNTVQIEPRELVYLHPVTLVALLMIVTGIWVGFSAPRSRPALMVAVTFILMGFSIIIDAQWKSIITLTEYLLRNSDIFLRAISLGLIFHFSLIWPHKHFNRIRLPLVIAGYLVPLLPVMALTATLSWMYITQNIQAFFGDFSLLETLSSLSAAIMLLATTIIFFYSYVTARNVDERRRTRWILLGSIIPLLFFVVQIVWSDVLDNAQLFPQWVTMIMMAMFPVFYSYSVIRHRSLDITFLFRRSLAYTLATGLVLLATAAAFVVLFRLPDFMQGILGGPRSDSLLGLPSLSGREWFLTAWALVVGLTIMKFKETAQNIIDRIFYRSRYDYRKALRGMADVLFQARDRQRVAEIVAENVENLVHPNKAYGLFVDNRQYSVITLIGPEPRVHLSEEEIQLLLDAFQSRNWLGLSEIQDGVIRNADALGTLVESLGIEILFAVKTDSSILGFLLLGPKLSEVPYSRSDIEMLELFVQQIAAGIERLRMSEDAARQQIIQKELEIGRSIQQSMLPARLPEVAGANIAVRSDAATEVGGDYYNFVEVSRQRFALVLGDIAGKGIPGAISMAAAISSVTLIAEHSESIPEAMGWFNTHLYRRGSGRSFSATIIALFDLEKQTLTWSDAGLPDPVRIGADGTVETLEMQQYSTPPGALRGAVYTEQRVSLHKGDTFLFHTDGIIESRDSQGEMYGEERLLAFCRNQVGARPDALLDALVEDIHICCGSVGRSDDLTAVVVQIED